MNQLPNTPLSTTAVGPLPDSKGSLGQRLDGMTQQGSDAVHRLSTEAEHWARHNAEQLRQQGQIWRQRSQTQIRDNPLRSVAVAAGVGVLVALWAGWLMRR